MAQPLIEFPSCGDMPLTFFQALASCAVTYSGVTMLNTITAEASCEDADSAHACDDTMFDPEKYCVDKFFGVDSCGRLALKIFNSQTPIP
jgi:hypothetical protein